MEWKEMLSGKTLSREKLLAYGFHERKGRLWLERGLSHGFTAVFCADTDVLQAEIRDEEKLPYLLAEVRSAQGSFVNEVREQTCRHAEQIISACVLQDNREKLLAYAHARYDTSAEYLWEKHPSYGVLRNAKGKWYAIGSPSAACSSMRRGNARSSTSRPQRRSWSIISASSRPII